METTNTNKTKKKKPSKIIKGCLSFFSLIVIWELACEVFAIPSYLFPAPLEIVTSFAKNINLISTHYIYTISEALLGIVIAILISCLLSFFIDLSPTFKERVEPFLVASQTIPSIVLLPFINLFMGTSFEAKVFLVVIMCFFPILVSVTKGFSRVREEEVNLFRLMGANKLEIYTKLKFPLVFKDLLGGLKIATTYAFSGAVVSEYLGGNLGIGVYLMRAQKAVDIAMVFVLTIIIILTTYILVMVLEYIIKRYEHY